MRFIHTSTGLTLGIVVLSSHLCLGQSDWSAVERLTSGQELKVILQDGASRRGSFESATDNGVVVRSGKGEQTLSRDQVTRILIEWKSHRRRNALIGAGIGAGAGLGAGASVDHCSKNSIVCTGNKGKAILTPAFALIGAGIGALIPSGGWRQVYRSR